MICRYPNPRPSGPGIAYDTEYLRDEKEIEHLGESTKAEGIRTGEQIAVVNKVPTIARKGRGNDEYPCGESGEVDDHSESDTTSQTMENN
jgi:hypothetical protein